MAIAFFIQVPVQTQLKSKNNMFPLSLLFLFGINLENKGCGKIKKEKSNGKSVRFQHFRLHFVEGSLLAFLL